MPKEFLLTKKDDTRGSRYHGVRMYSINADDYHRPSVLRRDRSHPILLLMSHGQVNSTERLNPKKPKQSAAQRMTLSKSCETRDHRMSLL